LVIHGLYRVKRSYLYKPQEYRHFETDGILIEKICSKSAIIKLMGPIISPCRRTKDVWLSRFSEAQAPSPRVSSGSGHKRAPNRLRSK